MRFTTTAISSLLVLALNTTPSFAQDASLSASLASMEASLSSKASQIAASATSNSASLTAAASSAIYSLTHCDPSFASWYHSVTSVLATETNSASLSSLESSLKLQTHTACNVIASSATASTMATITDASASSTAAGSSASASAAAATTTSATASGNAGTQSGPIVGMGMSGLILGLAAFL